MTEAWLSRSRQLRELRAHIRHLEGYGEPGDRAILPLGIEGVDTALPEGGLPRNALHEIRGQTGPATGFAAHILARIAAGGAPVLWMDAPGTLYAPGLLAFGVDPARLIVARGIRNTRDTLWAVEEALANPALGAVAAAVDRPDFTALRRLHLAARENGVTALLFRPEGAIGASPAVTRWHVTAAPSLKSDLPGIGATRWRLSLEKCRGGRETAFLVTRTAAGWDSSRPSEVPDNAATAPTLAVE